jgi:hypothetical protein
VKSTLKLNGLIDCPVRKVLPKSADAVEQGVGKPNDLLRDKAAPCEVKSTANLGMPLPLPDQVKPAVFAWHCQPSRAPRPFERIDPQSEAVTNTVSTPKFQVTDGVIHRPQSSPEVDKVLTHMSCATQGGEFVSMSLQVVGTNRPNSVAHSIEQWSDQPDWNSGLIPAYVETSQDVQEFGFRSQRIPQRHRLAKAIAIESVPAISVGVWASTVGVSEIAHVTDLRVAGIMKSTSSPEKVEH